MYLIPNILRKFAFANKVTLKKRLAYLLNTNTRLRGGTG